MFLENLREMLQPLTGEPGGTYELTEEDVDGQVYRVFKNVPPNLAGVYKSAAEQFPDKVFLVYGDERLTFSETYSRTCALAHELMHTWGVEKGDRIALSMRNYPEWALTYMAVTSIGAVIVPMNAWWTAPEMKYGLEDSGASLAVMDTQRHQQLLSLADDISLPTLVARPEAPLQGATDIADVIAAGAGKPMPVVAVSGDDDASIMYTSGTTGFPKGALASQRSIVQSIYTLEFSLAAARTLTPDVFTEFEQYEPCILLTVPLFHVTGSMAIFLCSFPIGRRIVMMRKWDAGDALRLIEEEQVTFFTGVPTMTWEMLRHPEFDRFNTDSLMTIGGGGAPAPPEQARQVNEKFKGNPGLGYGLTETNAMGATNTGALYLDRPQSTGVPAILVDVSIRGDDDSELPPNTPGEICLRGAVVVKGYWGKPEATEKAFRDGWFYTGDIGYVDEDGFLYISDRAKDMVLRGGENVYCAEVEAAIYEFDGVYECTVFGVPDERLGEIVGAAVMPDPGRSLDQDALRAHLLEKIAKFKVPEHIWFIDEQLPRNASGKILKREVRDKYVAELGLKAD
ncbi:MAG: acyl--CoA ligase [Gammaproteobacteria bacterium AqS3]|nr:acyl--CoA ligase [Gammaproteobacteria bacterium AqS3]